MSLGPVMLDIAGTQLTEDDLKRLLHPLTGGLILFARNYSNHRQLTELTQQIHALRTPHLLIAVDHEGEVVQLLHRGPLQCPARLHLIHFPVPEEGPDVLFAGVLDASVVQVLVDRGLVDRVDRADAHRAGRELPEVRHQVGVRVGGEALHAFVLRHKFLPVVAQRILAQAPLEKRPRVHARRRVRLEVHQIPAMRRTARVKEMLKPDLEQIGRRRVARDVPTEFAVRGVCAHHHRQRVPAQHG